MKAIWTIARRELRSLFDHPMGYILLFVFVGLNDFLFFRTAYLQGTASLRPLLGPLPWMFLVFVPAVTMRSLAEDMRAGTIEVVLAQPITEVEFLTGKYIGQLLFIWLALALTIAIPLGLSLGADIQVGVVFAQYVGAGLLATAFAAVGLWASSLSKNQVTAFIIAAAVTFLLIFLGTDIVLSGLPPILSGVAADLGVMSHFENIARGVIDLRDAVYFLTLAAVFLVLGYMSLMGRKLAPKGDTLKRLQLGTVLLVVVLVVVNLFGSHIGGRIDLTPGKVYSLSKTTKNMLGNLDDIVLIKLFASREIDPQFDLMKRDINDLLSDFRAAGGGMVRVTVLDPTADSEALNEAQSLGIPPVQFNVVGQSEFKVKEGYLGIAVQYADQTKTIPLVQQPENLEYQLASYIRDLTRESEPVIGFVEDQSMGQAQGGGFTVLRQALGEGYDVRTVDLDTADLDPKTMTVLVLAGSPMTLEDSIVEKVQNYLEQGGNAILMASGMQLSPQPGQPFAQALPVAFNKVLQPYGVSIKGDMVFDLISHEQASVPSRIPGMRVFRNYPFWLRAISTKLSTVNQDISTMFLPWSSEVDTTGALPGSITPLVTTTAAGGVEEGQAMVNPQRSDYPQTDLSERILGVMVNPLAAQATGQDTTSGAEPPRGRLVVVGNGEFARDGWVRNAQENLTFVLNAVDWLAQDEDMISIRSKNRNPPALAFESDTTRDFVKYSNVAGIPLLIVLAGVARMFRRRRSTKRVYAPLDRQEAR
jgi:ABC-2 type transport system permease protein